MDKHSLSDGEKLVAIGMWVATRSAVLAGALIIAKLFPIAVRFV